MTRTIAVKVDVDTLRGYLEGVPNLLALFAHRSVTATFFFSFGPDQSGRAIRRIFRPGFLSKMFRTKAPSTYGLKTLLYGTLLPAPLIVSPHPEPFLKALDTGQECGVHCWNHVLWQDKLPRLSRDHVKAELEKAVDLFEKLAGQRPTCCAAPGWQATAVSLDVQRELGFDYCSDARGRSPFYPVMDGFASDQLQIPATLPTMDEILGLPGVNDTTLPELWLRGCDKEWNVCTVHAEMEGLSKLAVLDRFLASAQDAGFVFAPLRDGTSHPAIYCTMERSTLPGRAGTVAVQGAPIGDSRG